MLDGVDGEIARAAQRTSKIGASLDSLTDAVTNLGFLAGLGIGLAQQGDGPVLSYAVAGFACFGVGLIALGVQALATGKTVTFDALKHVIRRRDQPPSNWVSWV